MSDNGSKLLLNLRCDYVTEVTIMCSSGLCAPLIQSGNSNLCPLPCSAHTQCGHCLANPQCGWCSEGDESLGNGYCAEGSLDGPRDGMCRGNSTVTMVNVIGMWVGEFSLDKA